MKTILRANAVFIAALTCVCLLTGDALAYVGPGAGGGGGSSIGIAAILVFVLVAAIGFCLLCGLIAAVVTVVRRFRLREAASQSQV